MEPQYNASPQGQRARRPIGSPLGKTFDTAVAAIILVLVAIESLMLVKLNYSADPSNESRVTQRDRGTLQHDLDWAHSQSPGGLPLQDHGR